MKILIILCFLLSRFVNSARFRANSRVDPLVLISQGLVRGQRSSDAEYTSFLGIPYAQVDYENPFGESFPPPSFRRSVFNAYDGSIACPQADEEGTLNCLRLNIYVPIKAGTRNPMPVLVWIHGGSFTGGKAGLYDGPNLVDENIILVSINYRLGPYGFLCLNTPTVPGNQGLKDQLTALRWIKDNISAFGGNPNDVTIAGQSAGGASIEYHMYSSQEKLFHKAILQSGVAGTATLFVNADVDAAVKIAAYLGFRTSNTVQALRFLTNASPRLVTAATHALGLLLGPCREKSFSGVENFVEADPFSMSNPKKIANTPILIGVTSNEMAYSRNVRTDRNVFMTFLQTYFNLSDEEQKKAESVIRHYYIGDEIASDSVKSELELFYSDFMFNHPAERSVSKFLEERSGPIYQYVYNYAHGEDNGTDNSIPHNAELKYLFASEDGNFNDEQKYVSDVLTLLWSNFIKYGNPTQSTNEQVPVIWKPVSSDTRPYLLIESSGVHLEHRFRHESMAFWDLFYKAYGQYNKLTRACKQ